MKLQITVATILLVLGIAYSVFHFVYKPINLVTVVLVGETKGVTKINFGCSHGEDLVYNYPMGMVVVLGDSEFNIKRKVRHPFGLDIMRVDSSLIDYRDPDNVDYLVSIKSEVQNFMYLEDDSSACGNISLIIEWN